MNALRIFIGWDSRESLAYDVCKRSIQRRSSIPTHIIPIKKHELKKRGLFWREDDRLSSTEFAFTRFLTPYLAGYSGWAIFADCDFLFRKDIAGILEYRDSRKALMCVKHEYHPKEKTKMDGQVQTVYPRKNWSSLMLINCGHDAVSKLTPEVVNSESGLYLHRFNWLSDDLIGSIPVEWNYLEGWNTVVECRDPSAVHFTRGGPWFEAYHGVEYADEWFQELGSGEDNGGELKKDVQKIRTNSLRAGG